MDSKELENCLTALYTQFKASQEEEEKSMFLLAYLSLLARFLEDQSPSSTLLVRTAAIDCILRNKEAIEDPLIRNGIIGLCGKF